MPYQIPYTICRHDVDFRGLAKPSALLRCCQQVAVEEAESQGINAALYARTHTAYLVAKLELCVARTPCLDEALTVRTEPEALHRAVNRRITTFWDAQGREAVCADSRWVLVDVDRRMILRKHPEGFPVGCWPDRVERELPVRLTKVRREDCEPLGAQCAAYSRCDANGHMNNTVYADLVCDALPPEVWQTGMLRGLVLYYHREIPMGQSTALYRAPLGENRWYLAGWQDDACNFEAQVTLGAPDAAE